MVVDFHTHIFPPRVKDSPGSYVALDPVFASMYDSPKTKIATVEDLIASMDEDGINTSVALNFAWDSHELCVETNDYIIEAVNKYPKRLIGFCAIQPGFVDLAIREIERCSQAGIKGIGELRLDKETVENDAIKPLIEFIIQKKLILLTHASEPVGHVYPGKGNSTPDILYQLITKFPQLKLVCAHWGGGLPFYAQMPEVRRAMSNVYFDTAASPFLYRPQIYAQVAPIIGIDRILYGTDFPLVPQSRIIKEIQASGLSRGDQHMILSANAFRVLDIKEMA